MFEKNSATSNKVWLTLSVLTAAITLFGAVFWGPAHGHSTEGYWTIFVLMSLHAYFLGREDREAEGERAPQHQV